MKSRKKSKGAHVVSSKNAFRFVTNGKRNRVVTSVVQEKVDVRVRRLSRLEGRIAFQEERISGLAQKLAEAEASGKKLSKIVFFKEASERKLVDLRAQAERTQQEIDILKSNGVEIKPTVLNPSRDLDQKPTALTLPEVFDDPAANAFIEDRRSIVDAARRWGDEHGVEGFVDTVDVDGKSFGVIRLHRAQYADTHPVDGVWSSFFSFLDSTPKERVMRRKAIENLLACATPDMKRMVDMLLTRGMLHMANLESKTLRSRVLPVCDDPEKRKKGLEALADFLIFDADEYSKNFK